LSAERRPPQLALTRAESRVHLDLSLTGQRPTVPGLLPRQLRRNGSRLTNLGCIESDDKQRAGGLALAREVREVVVGLRRLSGPAFCSGALAGTARVQQRRLTNPGASPSGSTAGWVLLQSDGIARVASPAWIRAASGPSTGRLRRPGAQLNTGARKLLLCNNRNHAAVLLAGLPLPLKA